MTKHLRFFMLTLLTIVCTVGGYSQTWEKVSLTDLTTDDVFVIVGTISNKTYALPNTETNKKPAAVAITISTDGNQITGDVTDNLKWNIEKSEEKYTFYPNGNKKAWLYSSSNSTDLGIGSTGTNKTFKYVAISSKQYEGLLNTSTNRYICIYSNKDWRAYTNNNIKATKISYYKYTTSSTSSATTTTFGTDSGKTFTFTNGKLDGFTAPKATATKSDDNTNLSNLIEYTSSDADIVAVDSKTGELTFTNTKFGKATITATLPKTDTYQTSTDSYVVENKDNHTATSLSFNGTDVTLTEGKTDAGTDFTGYTATEANNIAGTITYAASGDAVATVDPATGAVTINAAVYGTTTITATFTPAYPTQYSGSTATYKITNKKAVDLSEITFDVSEDKSNNSSQQIADNLNKSIVKIYSTKAILGNGTDYRFYKDSKTTFSLTDPTRVITSIKFIHSNTTGPNFTTDKNTYDKASGTWTGYEESVTFTNPGTVIRNITQIIVTTAEKKAAPALSFAEATVTKELVAGTIDLQTITKPEDLDPSAITYASSDDATAKVEGNTIHMYKTGEVTITATSAATDKYAAGTASYKLVIEDNRTTDADFKFAAESYNADLAEATAGIVTFNAANVLQNPNNLKVTYTISPESANATIEGTDGKALIKVSGTYTITAIGANDTYKETTATCTLKVINSAVEETSIEFIAGVDKGKQTGIGNEDQIVQGVVTIHGTNAAFAAVSSNKYTYRLYQDCITTISTKIGKITKIEFVKGDKPINNLKYNGKDGAFTADTKYDLCWVGSAKEVVFTNTDQARATKIIVTVEVPKAKNYTLDETKTDNVIETYENANVTLQRTLSKDYWNTFCVPFALDAEQVTQYFGEGTQLRTYEGYCNNNIVYFATVDNIEAGKPYIMKPGNAVVQNPTFEGVSMVATGLDKKGNPQAVGDASTVQMKGIYNQIELKADQTELFLGDNDLFYYPLDDIDARTIGGLRAYFIVPQGTDIKKLRANLDGTPTSLGTIFDTEESNAPVYNLQGQCVGNSLRALKSGIYIQNGKKVVVK
ncbi:hypothetical protein [Leyella stercorea]|uniref:hypothetical protein n=1 Tax=Leyella stercorea TaxID=363265 RepID=UPI00242B4CD8|nr:hypothetical protein [Leyella stercorea]